MATTRICDYEGCENPAVININFSVIDHRNNFIDACSIECAERIFNAQFSSKIEEQLDGAEALSDNE